MRLCGLEVGFYILRPPYNFPQHNKQIVSLYHNNGLRLRAEILANLCRHPLLLVEWLKNQAGLKRNAAKSSSTKGVSFRQLANRKENMSDSDDESSAVKSIDKTIIGRKKGHSR